MKTIDLKDWERAAVERGATQLRRVCRRQPIKSQHHHKRWLLPCGLGKYWTNEMRRDVHSKTTGKRLSSETYHQTPGELIQSHAKCPFGIPGETVVLKTHHRAKVQHPGVRVVIEAVRVERVQETVGPDFAAMGWPENNKPISATDDTPRGAYVAVMDAAAPFSPYGDSALEWYAAQLDADHGAGTWDRNPWQWVVSFRPAG